MIDLRSDTMTAPTDAMLRAAALADAGDDCYGESKATRELELMVADLTGKEDAVFVPSGTMSNQIALKSFVLPGNEVLCESSYHINFFESAQSSAISQVSLNTIRAPGGRLSPALLDDALDVKARWSATYSTPQLVWLENTINSEGGAVVTLAEMKAVQAWADTKGLPVFLDGARALNAAIALRTSLAQVASTVDALSICFAKGLGAPMGSALAGDADVVARARYFRKQLGGGMHQSGFAAAAASYALVHHVDRLAHDHQNAAEFGDAIRNEWGPSALAYDVQSNMVMLDVGSHAVAQDLVRRAENNGVRLLHWRGGHVRAVFRIGITRADARSAAQRISALLPTGRPTAYAVL